MKMRRNSPHGSLPICRRTCDRMEFLAVARTGVAVVALISGWRPLPRLHIPFEFVVHSPEAGDQVLPNPRCVLCSPFSVEFRARFRGDNYLNRKAENQCLKRTDIDALAQLPERRIASNASEPQSSALNCGRIARSARIET